MPSSDRALDRKDAAAVTRESGPLAPVLTRLLLAAGPADRALEALHDADLPPAARVLAERLAATVAAIRAQAPDLRLTIDPVEFRGFKYETGVSVTVFAPGRHEELGRGGRYVCGGDEPATGLTLYPDAILRVAPARAPKDRVYIPFGADRARAAGLRAQGFATVAGLTADPNPEADAIRLGCTHILRAGIAAVLPTKD